MRPRTGYAGDNTNPGFCELGCGHSAMLDDPRFWIRIALILFTGFMVWELLRPKWPVRLVVDGRGVRAQRGISKGREQELDRFFRDVLSLERKVTIQAKRESNGVLRVRCRGRVDAGTKQQIRNFLLSVL